MICHLEYSLILVMKWEGKKPCGWKSQASEMMAEAIAKDNCYPFTHSHETSDTDSPRVQCRLNTLEFCQTLV